MNRNADISNDGNKKLRMECPNLGPSTVGFHVQNEELLYNTRQSLLYFNLLDGEWCPQ